MGLDKVIVEKGACDFHEDERRTIISPFNSDISDFAVWQTKAIIMKDKKRILGGHYHNYREMYGIVGNAVVALEDPNTKERKIYEFETRDRILIPSGIAHLVLLDANGILLGHTEEAYKKGMSDIPYDFGNLFKDRV